MNRPFRFLAAACVLALLGGCVTVPREAGFGDVQNAVAQRGGQLVQWRGRTTEDAAADAAVAALLARPLTAEAAVQIALLNNRHLQATYEELGIAQAELVQAGLLKNPVFEFDPRWPTKSGYEFNYEVTVTQDFLDIFFIPLRKRIAENQFEQAKLRVAGEVIDRAAEVRQAFYRHQAAEQLLEMRRTVSQATEAGADAAKRLREAGNVTRLRVDQEQALHERAKLALAQAEAEAVDAREELNALMGLWGRQTQWTADAHLPDLPGAEVDAKGLESLAASQRLDLAAAERQARAFAQSLGLSGWEVWSFTTGVHAESEPDPDGPINIGPHLEGSFPLFDQGQARIAQAAARLRQARQEHYALAVDIRAQVRRARNRLFTARERAAYYRAVVLPLRQRITHETQLQYNAMDVGVFELLQAKQEEIDAGKDYIESLRDYWLARAELEKAVGGKLPAGSDGEPATPPATAPAPPAQPQPQHGTHP